MIRAESKLLRLHRQACINLKENLMTKKPRKPAAMVEAKQVTMQEIVFRIVNDSDSAGRSAAEVKYVYEHVQKKTINTHSAHLKFLVDKGYIVRKWYPPSEKDKMGFYRYWSTEAGRNKFGVASAADVLAANKKGAREFAENLEQLGRAVMLSLFNGQSASAIGMQKSIRIGQAMPTLDAIEAQLTALAVVGMVEGTGETVRSASGSVHESMKITEDGILVAQALKEIQAEALKSKADAIHKVNTKDQAEAMYGANCLSVLCALSTKAEPFTIIRAHMNGRRVKGHAYANALSENSTRFHLDRMTTLGLVEKRPRFADGMISYFGLTEEGARIRRLVLDIKDSAPAPELIKPEALVKVFDEYEVIPTMDAKRLYFAVRNDGAMKAVSGKTEIEFSPDDTKVLYNLLSAIHGTKQ